MNVSIVDKLLEPFDMLGITMNVSDLDTIIIYVTFNVRICYMQRIFLGYFFSLYVPNMWDQTSLTIP